MKILSHNITNNGTTILGMNLRELDRMVIQTNCCQLIKLSICSKRISTQINSARLYSQKVVVVLNLRKQISVLSRNDKDNCEIFTYPDSGKRHNSNAQQVSIACCTVNAVSIPIGIKTFWKNQEEGFLSVIRHLLKMFQCKISTGQYCWRQESFQPILTELFDLQQEFGTITVGLHETVDHKWLNHIFSYLGLVERLEILSTNFLPPSTFIPTFPPWPRRRIIIESNSSWLTLDILFTCTCSYIDIAKTNLENKELDDILTHWKAGGLPNLKYLEIGSTKFKRNGDPILEMVPNEWEGQLTIRTDDGSKTAKVHLRGNYLVMYTLLIDLNF
ncbi:hypothetical protein GCK72_003125 [Caenorhabditis remanei]|uniref:Sdz-33 F-box domain-containing protein n=1 Tax=Caenorhabditis remanei TaxID=31234 RepID=A0A6A5HU78_CAERE|nr:hypothetical protein GCK72_003125 [Caenorhabditis remanei]KAF1771299.1 hypothetical protein GCK72_003125 [Caenorhabditis remanei]